MDHPALSLVYFPSALALGALHALEPGHAKTLTAAYLIGIKGTVRDSVVLGLAVAATHSGVVVAISALGLWLGNEAFAGEAAHWLERASGMVAVLIGCWMLWRRLRRRKPALSATPQFVPVSGNLSLSPHPHPGHSVHEHHHHPHDHDHLDDDAHARAHAADIPDYVHRGERPTFLQILTFGAAGGMIPCPASITVMLLALSTRQTGLGLLTVLGFSIGLAITLVGLGLVVVTGLSRLGTSGRFGWLSRRAPALSAGLVIASGLFALLIAH